MIHFGSLLYRRRTVYICWANKNLIIIIIDILFNDYIARLLNLHKWLAIYDEYVI